MKKVKVTFLIDDKPGKDLADEHGLSILIETGERKILFDTGQSGKFLTNADKLGVDLKSVDFAIISHGHYDHGGGLPGFLDLNESAPVYVHPLAMEPVYYSKRKNGEPRYIGIRQDAFSAHPNRFIHVDSATEPAPGIHILPCTEVADRGSIFSDHSMFLLKDNSKLKETFDHEIFMVIERESEMILISGCSHNSITEIIRHAQRLFPGKSLKAVIGGFHLPDLEDFSDRHSKATALTAEQLAKIARKNKVESGEGREGALFYTGHCTGDRAKLILQATLGDKIDFFHSGLKLLL